MSGNIVIFGPSGLVGGAALRHFDALPDWNVVALSRRPPAFEHGGRFIALDLTDRDACERTLGELADTTHIIYTALYEEEDVIRGWRAKAQMQTNLAMLQNALRPLDAVAKDLTHISLFQGTKAYGAHLRPPEVPARERWARNDHENFYWYQEDFVKAQQKGKAWHWTIWRPQTIFGFALDAPLNILLAMAVYAVIRRAEGLPLCHPGGGPYVTEAIDTRLIARALDWAGGAAGACDEIFNITNGDNIPFPGLWPTLARHFGMRMGPPEPMRLQDIMPTKAHIWDAIAKQHNLRPVPYEKLVGQSWQFADFNFAAGKNPAPVVVSTIKLRQHGFQDCIDTEDMLIELLEQYQAEGILPR
ncbi:MAG: NAD-dependent epimerase/dehydratase family protein [Rhodospirillaceae bacterium]|nr:NAD-dependent epimerase/dehydratase family protein [Rhodospirillaceae bacterium]